MFSAENETFKLVNVNPRVELHGEDKVPTVDIKIEATMSNDVLSVFHPSLKSAIYKKADDAQGELIDDPGYLPALKFPNMTPFGLTDAYKGYSLTVHYGIGGDSDIKMADCEVDHFKFAPKEGGSVTVTMRIIAHPKTDDIGKLCSLIQQEVELTLLPPEEQQELKEAA
jgi:hypothetical protein